MKIILTEKQYIKLLNENDGTLDGFIYEFTGMFPETESYKNIIKEFIKKSGCQKIELKNIKSGAFGLSLHDGVVINDIIGDFSVGRALYVVFHEIAHQYQYKKYGKEYVYRMYTGEISVEDATKLLRKIETVADQFALRKCRELVQLGHIEKNQVPTKGSYEFVNDKTLKFGLINFRNLIRASKITDQERISEIIYNYIVNFNKNEGDELMSV